LERHRTEERQAKNTGVEARYLHPGHVQKNQTVVGMWASQVRHWKWSTELALSHGTSSKTLHQKKKIWLIHSHISNLIFAFDRVRTTNFLISPAQYATGIKTARLFHQYSTPPATPIASNNSYVFSHQIQCHISKPEMSCTGLYRPVQACTGLTDPQLWCTSLSHHYFCASFPQPPKKIGLVFPLTEMLSLMGGTKL
jgi:hypothetical protein